MSNYIKEILQDLANNPETFKDYLGEGVTKGNITITDYGNGRILSTIQVYINEKRIPTSYIDRWELDIGLTKWYRTVSLKVLSS